MLRLTWYQITWIFPFIGHTGIADSNGVIYDFAGPYSIGKGKMLFGKWLELTTELLTLVSQLNSCSTVGEPTKYIQLSPSLCRESDWDSAVHEGCDIYSRRMHNICFDNCHSHVAKCLNIMAFDNKRDYNMFTIGVWFFFQGTFVDCYAFIKTFLPFTILLVGLFLLGFFAWLGSSD
jgi:hypothetical protein